MSYYSVKMALTRESRGGLVTRILNSFSPRPDPFPKKSAEDIKLKIIRRLAILNGDNQDPEGSSSLGRLSPDRAYSELPELYYSLKYKARRNKDADARLGYRELKKYEPK